jgi:hypothetical protein
MAIAIQQARTITAILGSSAGGAREYSIATSSPVADLRVFLHPVQKELTVRQHRPARHLRIQSRPARKDLLARFPRDATVWMEVAIASGGVAPPADCSQNHTWMIVIPHARIKAFPS